MATLFTTTEFIYISREKAKKLIDLFSAETDGMLGWGFSAFQPWAATRFNCEVTIKSGEGAIQQMGLKFKDEEQYTLFLLLTS